MASKKFVGPPSPADRKKAQQGKFVGPPSPADRKKAQQGKFVGPPSPFKEGSRTFVGPPRPTSTSSGARASSGTGKVSAKAILRRQRAEVQRKADVKRKAEIIKANEIRQQVERKQTEQRRRAEFKSKIEQKRESQRREQQRITSERLANVNRRISILQQKPQQQITLRQRDEIKALRITQSRLKQQQKKGPTLGVVTKVIAPTGFVTQKLEELRQLENVKSTKSIRTKQKDIRNELKLAGVVVARTLVEGTVAIVTLPKTLFNVAKDPKQLLRVPGALKESGERFGQLLRVSPTQAFVKIGSEVLFVVGAGKSARIVGEVSKPQLTKTGLLGKFRKIDKDKITFTRKGKTTTIKVGGTVKKIAEPLPKQARLAGKQVTAVSAQADKLVNLIKTKRIVRKPIPGEAEFSKSTKRLLSKFDKGTINKKELIKLENEVPLLERSFFADPRGRFRPSRLGAKQKDASLLDFLSGDFTFRTAKPQILVFEDVTIAKFPKNLEDVAKALKTGKTLTSSQARRLLRFQSKKTGEFKPIGALSKEPEITLAPGEIIKKVKKVGVTLVNGKTVEIVLAKAVKAKPTTTKLLKKANKGKLTAKELKKLRKNLQKETGFKTRLGSRKGGVKPRARLPKRVTRKAPRKVPRVSRVVRKGQRTSRISARKERPRGGVTRPSRKVRRASTPARTARPPRRATRPPTGVRRPPLRVARPVKGPPVIAPKLTIRKKRIKRKKKKKQGFNVIAKPIKTLAGKKAKRGIRINKVPLTKARADDLSAFISDTSLARTSRTVPTKGKAQNPKLKIPRGFAKKTAFKFRKFRIIKGKKVPLKGGKIIERSAKGRNFLLDTPQEKRGITLRKRLKQISKPKRKISAAQRKILIKRLKKARRVKRRLNK